MRFGEPKGPKFSEMAEKIKERDEKRKRENKLGLAQVERLAKKFSRRGSQSIRDARVSLDAKLNKAALVGKKEISIPLFKFKVSLFEFLLATDLDTKPEFIDAHKRKGFTEANFWQSVDHNAEIPEPMIEELKTSVAEKLSETKQYQSLLKKCKKEKYSCNIKVVENTELGKGKYRLFDVSIEASTEKVEKDAEVEKEAA